MDGHEAGGDRTVPVAGVAPGRTGAARRPAAPAPVGDHTVPVRRRGAPTLVVSAAVTRPAGNAQPVARPVFHARPPRPASVAPAPPRAPRPASPAPTGGRLGDRAARLVQRLHPAQAVCWQVAVLAIVLTARQPWPALAGATAGAAVLLGLTGVRVRGRWGYELAGLLLGFHLRARRHDLPMDAGAAPALLGLVLPGCTTRTVETAQGPALAISHQCGLSAVLRPRDPTPELVGSVPDPAALLPASEGAQELAVQAVFHAGASPGAAIRLWLAVHAARTVDTALDEELILVLRNGLRRVRQALKRAGIPTEPLPEDAAFAAITALAHVTGGRTGVREDWRFVRTGPVSQACFALDGWHRLAAETARRLVPRMLGRTGGIAATLTLAARTLPHGGTRSDALLRLAATTEVAVDRTARGIAELLTPAGVGVVRLDGAHLPALAASLPIGGLPR